MRNHLGDVKAQQRRITTRGRHRRRLAPWMIAALSLCLVLALVVGLATLGASAPSALAGTSGCKDFFYISMSGSGEHFGKNAQDLTSSPETAAVKAGIDQAFTNKLGQNGDKPTYDVENINYPATAIDGMKDAFKRLGLAAAAPLPPQIKGPLVDAAVRGVQGAVASYLAGERRGESALGETINRLKQQCTAVGRKAKFVLAGYSQGAMAVHNYLANNEGRAEIVGTVLIADPERTPNTGMHNYASAYNSDPRSFGLCSVLLNSPRIPGRPSCLPNYAPIPPIPPGLRDSTVDVCVNNDIVCETSQDVDLAHPSSFGSIDPGYNIHIKCNFYCGSPTRLAGQDMGRRVLAATSVPVGPALKLLRTSGPAGLTTFFESIPCADLAQGQSGNSLYSVAVVNAAGKKIDAGSAGGIVGGRLPGGGHPFAVIHPKPVPGQTDFPEATPGKYTLNVSCLSQDEHVVMTFPPVTYTVSGPSQTIIPSTRTVARGSTVTFTPTQPCPAAFDTDSPAHVELHDLESGNGVIGTSYAAVPANGRWSTALTVPRDMAPGRYSIDGDCRDLFYGYSGDLVVS